MTNHHQAPAPSAVELFASLAGGDPRVRFARACAVTGSLLASITAEQLGDPTPCTEFDVQHLAGHLVSVLRRVADFGVGGNGLSIPVVSTDVLDGSWNEAWSRALLEVERVWSASGILERELTLPWTSMSGADAIGIYTNEVVVHGWDLARGLGCSARYDDEVVDAAFAAAEQQLPAEYRGGEIPFGPVTGTTADAPALDRLAAWNGRSV